MCKRVLSIFSVVLLGFLFLLSSQLVMASIDNPIALQEGSPVQEDYPDAGGVYLKSEMIADYTAIPYRTEITRIIKVFNKRGIDYFGEDKIRYNQKWENIEVLEAVTIKPDGSIVEVKQNAIHDITPPELSDANIYSDVRDKVINFPALEPGSIIVCRYLIEEEKPLIEGEFWASRIFQDIEPIEESTLILKAPSDKRLFYYTRSGEIEPRIIEEEGCSTYIWQESDVPAIVAETAMPPYYDVVPTVMVSTMKSWDDVSSWYDGLIDQQYEINQELRDKIAELTSGFTDTEEKIRILYNYVALNIRYVGLEFGIGGYKPHLAVEVFDNKYGDCKDMATLLIAMLREIGVKAEPVLINASYYPDLRIVSPDNFNHMIVYLPEQGIYMDPTSDVTMYGLLPNADEGKKVLFPLENRIAETPVSDAENNQEAFIQKVKLHEDGSAELNIDWVNTGIYDMVYKELFKQFNQQERQIVIQQLSNSFFIGAQLSDYKMTGVDGLDEAFYTQLNLTINNYARSMGDLLSFKPNRIPVNVKQLVGSQTRIYPMFIGYNLNIFRDVEIELPEAYVLEYLPEDIKIINSVGSLQVNYQEFDGKVRVVYDLQTYKPMVEVEEYEELRELFNEASDVLENTILIKEAE
ncbi:MAG TPA: DUF3857 and transglutaminase domain-containing protein [Halanaerobiales bacterium]|nr:DUF3857 and transglutaminase domain-containing protein [Halanaerobiales bacterium]